jgi:hypothetical protein
MAANAEAVSGIGDIAGKLFEEEMSAQVSGSLSTTASALNDLRMEVDAQPDHNTRNKMYAEGASKIVSESRKGLQYPRFQSKFDKRIFGTMERGRVFIEQGVRKAQVSAAGANRMLFIEGQIDALENISDPEERAQTIAGMHKEMAAGVSGGSWSAQQSAYMQIRAENRIEGHRLIAEAQAFADDVRDLPAAEQIAAVQAMPPGKSRAKADALVHHQIEADRSLKIAAHEKSTDALYFQVEAGRWEDGTPVTPESILKKAEADGLGMQETRALLDRLPTVAEPTAASRKAEFTLKSKDLRDSLEDAATRGSTQEEFFGMDFYAKKKVIDPETGEQAVDENGQPMFRPSIASMLTTADLKHLNTLKKDGPAGKILVGKAKSIEARDEYLMAINTHWVSRDNKLWKLNEDVRKERTRAIQQWDDAVAHEAASAPGPARDWLYPKELREITRKLLTPQVLDTGTTGFAWGFFSPRSALRPDQLTPEYLDEQMGSMKDIATYPLEAAEAEVAQMDEAEVDEIRQRDLSYIGRESIGDGNDVESLRDILLIRRNDLNQMTKGTFR